MNFNRKQLLVIKIFISLGIFTALVIGISLGIALASTQNTKNLEYFSEYTPALPSQVVDIKGRLITEFFSEEKRELISIEELPKHLIYAFITREDVRFYQHNGFDPIGFSRAVWNNIKDIFVPSEGYFSGGSTLTQQVAGVMYADRSDISIRRKLIELWWAFQLERRYTKNEILELYLNTVYLGHNTYGVEAASQYYFQHSARDVTLAEAVILAIQNASPALNSPINHPTRAKKIQREILDQMVELGYAEQEEADASFERYWDNYDWTRLNTSTAYMDKEDKAPYFSEYVRIQLDKLLTGTREYNTDGYVIHTTLNLDYQELADKYMNIGLSRINTNYKASSEERRSAAEKKVIPIIEMLSLAFDLEDFRAAGLKQQQKMRDLYYKKINPLLDVVSLMIGSDTDDEIFRLTRDAYLRKAIDEDRTTVEGALITLGVDTGYILSMVGGSRFEGLDEFNRAVQARVEPGSSFKPLYYSAAIDSRDFTTATVLSDTPVVFLNDDGSPYTPMNYIGAWEGDVLLRRALANSMNVPSLRVLDGIGFDAALNRAGELLGIPKREWVERGLVRKYPIGLGVVAVAPIEMARAYSIFANQGKEVTPMAIRYIEDRNGRRILEPEREIREEQIKKGEDIQVISPQTAYIMVDILRSTVEWGTLRWPTRFGEKFNMPVSGKTGTTQNWSDAWTVGFSPYMTTAVWFGFDHGGESLGVNQTGATAAGPIWADYMAEIHKNLEPKEFPKPTSGLTEVTVSTITGLLPPKDYPYPTRKEIFLSGTEPVKYDRLVQETEENIEILAQKLEEPLLLLDSTGFQSSGSEDGDFTFTLPSLDVDLDSDTDSSGSSGSSGENPLLD